MNPLISIVSPVYKAENIVSELVLRIKKTVLEITENFEIILVCDGSPDNSWQEIARQCAIDKRVKGLNLSRNFGQESAISAGLESANGEWIVVMDCDLQDNPADIVRLYNKAQEGYDVVFAQRTLRKDNWFKRLNSKLFYIFFNYLTETKQSANIGNFGIFNHKVIANTLKMNDSVRVFITMIHWVGFRHTTIDSTHEERFDGTSSYSFTDLCKLSLDVILSFSNKPLKLMVKFGFVLSLLSFLVGIYFLVLYLTGKTDVSGFTSIIISLWFIAGLLIFFIGILGLYLGQIFNQVKNRPRYVIDEKKNC